MTNLKNIIACRPTARVIRDFKMINKWIQFTVASKDCNIFAKTLKYLQEESQKERGCHYYAAFQSEDDLTHFTVLEQWIDNESFENHRVAPHILSFKNEWGNKILTKTSLSLNSI